jgi:peptidyl-dipeptidase A
MTNFERKLYQEPDSDLDSLWWELKRRYQLLAKPAGRQAPDWAAKYHIALAPVYYQNYLLGNLVTAQLNARMDEAIGGFGLNPKVGEFLKDQVFAGGAILPWSDHVEAATGQPLDPGFFTRQLQ